MFYVKQRQKVKDYRGFGGFCWAVRQSIWRVFVELAVLIAGEYLLSAEIWVAAYVCPKRLPRVCCVVVSDEALSMKMLSGVDGVYCLVV